MVTGVQFTGELPPGTTRRWYTHGWSPGRQVHWSIMPTTPRSSGPQVEWDVESERAADSTVTYWITVRNLTWAHVRIQGRYAIINA